ncbi:sulfite exporter TauE/SafE family protein [Methanocella sp. CWC-04]|uniref:Probable membrane transporter protein n=1 Tax=Methanooceanicella nereidis TaxID=2052831 RepID=A0AAP2REE5_9EURY|nr:sulfite exporter TauE/SafE family protein [Methanocella sp. CWC-04]MCD1296164.1 sulfite exporter TauE/SafE family protein [Methanocella sp. CWC-04]
MEPFNIILLFLSGLISGAFGGMIGIGGSTLLVPILTLAMGMPVHTVIPIGLLNNIAVSSSAVLKYHKMGLLHKNTVMIMNIGSVPGIIAGTYIASISTDTTIKLIFGGFLLVVLMQALIRKDGGENVTMEEPENIDKKGFSILGFFMGLLGALLGIGGGVIAVPVQVHQFKVPLRNAIANSLGTIVLASSLGALIYISINAGRLFSPDDVIESIIFIAPGSIIGATLSAKTSKRLPERYIKYIFYATVAYIAYRMITSGLGM